MVNYINTPVFQPSIPKHLINAEDERIIKACGITLEPDGKDKYYLYAEELSNGYLVVDGEETEITEDYLWQILQTIIRRSSGELTWISQKSALTCTRMRADGFGGYAIFITANDIRHFSTSNWLEQQIREEETGDKKESQKQVVGIVVDGGLVQSVVSSQPLAALDFVVIDYDVYNIDNEDPTLGIVLHQDGITESAYMKSIEVETPTIDLGSVSNFISNNAYGANQHRIAINGVYPCDGCKDINLSGEGCSNEDKCLAWLHYHNY